jgi:hypothetical protein
MSGITSAYVLFFVRAQCYVVAAVVRIRTVYPPPINGTDDGSKTPSSTRGPATDQRRTSVVIVFEGRIRIKCELVCGRICGGESRSGALSVILSGPQNSEPTCRIWDGVIGVLI